MWHAKGKPFLFLFVIWSFFFLCFIFIFSLNTTHKQPTGQPATPTVLSPQATAHWALPNALVDIKKWLLFVVVVLCCEQQAKVSNVTYTSRALRVKWRCCRTSHCFATDGMWNKNGKVKWTRDCVKMVKAILHMSKATEESKVNKREAAIKSDNDAAPQCETDDNYHW